MALRSPLALSLAVRTWSDQPRRFIATSAGIAFATLLVAFQFSLFFGFIRASGIVPAATGAAIWVTPRRTPNVEFSDVLEKAVVNRALSLPGVLSAEPVVTTFARFRGPAGARTAVGVVGLSRPLLRRILQLPSTTHCESMGEPAWFDASNAGLLGLKPGGPVAAEVEGWPVCLAGALEGYASFLGSPYLFVDVDFARRLAGMEDHEASFIAVELGPNVATTSVVRAIESAAPEVEALPTDEFRRRAAIFWMTRTGAGGGFLIAAILGAVVGAVVVYQALYSSTLERAVEFATLKAIGASPTLLRRAILLQGALCGITGGLAGVVLAVGAVEATRQTIVPWIFLPFWLEPTVVCVGIALAAGAAGYAGRLATSQDPARVFRS